MAIAVRAWIKAKTRSSPERASVRAFVSGRGIVIASSNFASSTSLTLLGVATVTRPAPTRSAAWAANAAAPVFPRTLQ